MDLQTREFDLNKLIKVILVYYLAKADLNTDGRINGTDHTIASLLNDTTVYDIESFAYDKNGNRTKLVQNGDTYTYEYGKRNRLNAVYVQKGDSAGKELFLNIPMMPMAIPLSGSLIRTGNLCSRHSFRIWRTVFG